MPFAGEIGVVVGLLQHRAERPFRMRKSATLALEGDGGHAAAVGDAPGLDRGTARRAARLAVEIGEDHAFLREPVEVRGLHAPRLAAEIGAKIAPAGVVGDDQQDVGPLGLRASVCASVSCAWATPPQARSAATRIAPPCFNKLIWLPPPSQCPIDAGSRYSSGGNISFQSFFMSTTTQPLSGASSSALSRRPTDESRS